MIGGRGPSRRRRDLLTDPATGDPLTEDFLLCSGVSKTRCESDEFVLVMDSALALRSSSGVAAGAEGLTGWIISCSGNKENQSLCTGKDSPWNMGEVLQESEKKNGDPLISGVVMLVKAVDAGADPSVSPKISCGETVCIVSEEKERVLKVV